VGAARLPSVPKQVAEHKRRRYGGVELRAFERLCDRLHPSWAGSSEPTADGRCRPDRPRSTRSSARPSTRGFPRGGLPRRGGTAPHAAAPAPDHRSATCASRGPSRRCRNVLRQRVRARAEPEPRAASSRPHRPLGPSGPPRAPPRGTRVQAADADRVRVPAGTTASASRVSLSTSARGRRAASRKRSRGASISSDTGPARR